MIRIFLLLSFSFAVPPTPFPRATLVVKHGMRVSIFEITETDLAFHNNRQEKSKRRLDRKNREYLREKVTNLGKLESISYPCEQGEVRLTLHGPKEKTLVGCATGPRTPASTELIGFANTLDASL